MLHRSSSSRRRRASPGMANSSQPAGVSSMRGRRASVATEKPLILPPSSPGETMERQRSPRGSMVPNIALDTEGHSDEVSIHPLTSLEFLYNFFIYILSCRYYFSIQYNPQIRLDICAVRRGNVNLKAYFLRKIVYIKRLSKFLKRLQII